METKFQTSFIPKKPLVPEMGQKTNEPINLFTVIGVLFLIVSLAAAGGVYGWVKVIEKHQVSLKADIAHNRDQFGTDIKFLERFNTKINLSRELLSNHLAVEGIFDIVSKITTSNVRFTSFDIIFPTSSKERAVMTMKGTGTSLSVLAFQSDVFGESKYIKDPVISDFAVSDKGDVTFSFSAGIDPSLLSFKKTIDGTLERLSSQDGPTLAPTATGTSTQQ